MSSLHREAQKFFINFYQINGSNGNMALIIIYQLVITCHLILFNGSNGSSNSMLMPLT
jgi:hypothetical protein